MKYSIIIPVYNVEKYLKKCLDSIINQTYSDYEVIIVDDGSPDNSAKIIQEFERKDNRFKYFTKANGGLSDARNFGINKATGDYLIFLDGDDCLSPELIEKINIEATLYPHVELIKFNTNYVTEEGEILKKTQNKLYHDQEIKDVISNLINDNLFEAACSYAYQKKFWDQHKFQYPKGKIHEDFALTPLILTEAKKISSISYHGYNYVQRENSIVHEKDYEKIKLKTCDILEHAIMHNEIIKKKDIDNHLKKVLLNFSAKAIIYKSAELNDQDITKIAKEIKKHKLINNIDFNGLKLVKTIYLNLFLEKYIKTKCRKYMEGE